MFSELPINRAIKTFVARRCVRANSIKCNSIFRFIVGVIRIALNNTQYNVVDRG